MRHVASFENRLSECLASCDESCPQCADLFVDKADYQQFIDLLKETADLFNVNVAAFCLMPTHYHKSCTPRH
jgi:REP element-mobilizing transposase RayT